MPENEDLGLNSANIFPIVQKNASYIYLQVLFFI